MRLRVLGLALTVLLIVACSGLVFCLSEEDSQNPSRHGLLGGTFLQLTYENASWEKSKWEDLFRSMQELQMSQLIVQWTVYDSTAFYPSQELDTVEKPPLETILNLADNTGISVWLGLVQDSGYWDDIRRSTSLVEVHLQKRRVDGRRAAKELAELVEGHSSFKGWYLNEEIDDRNWLPQAARRVLVLHLRQLITYLHEVSPGRPVAISSFSSGYADPKVFGDFWNEVLREAPIDLLLFQDGIGVKKLDLYGLPLYLASLRDVVGQHATEMRVVVELFEQTSRWDEPFDARPAELDRVLRQLELAAEFSRKAPIAFSILEYMAPFGERRAKDLYQRYLAESKSR